MTVRPFNPGNLPLHPAPHLLTAAPDGQHWRLPVSLAPSRKGLAGLVSVWPDVRAMLHALPAGALKAQIDEHGADWIGATAERIASRAIHGAPHLRDTLAPLLRRLTVEAPLETARRVRVAAVAGTAPRVAAWVAGQPRAMTRRVQATSPLAPLNVVVDTTSVWRVSAEAVARRAAAIAAWVQRLSAIRPVVLWGALYGAATAAPGHHSLTMWRVHNSADPAQLWPIAAPECPRGLAGAICDLQMGVGTLVLCGELSSSVIAPLFPPSETVVCVPGIRLSHHDAKTFETDERTLAWLEQISTAVGAPVRLG